LLWWMGCCGDRSVVIVPGRVRCNDGFLSRDIADVYP